MDDLLASDRFIARSDYSSLIPQYEQTYTFFNALQTSGMLGDYAKKNNLTIEDIERFLKLYVEIINLADGSYTVKKHNDVFVS